MDFGHYEIHSLANSAQEYLFIDKIIKPGGKGTTMMTLDFTDAGYRVHSEENFETLLGSL